MNWGLRKAGITIVITVIIAAGSSAAYALKCLHSQSESLSLRLIEQTRDGVAVETSGDNGRQFVLERLPPDDPGSPESGVQLIFFDASGEQLQTARFHTEVE